MTIDKPANILSLKIRFLFQRRRLSMSFSFTNITKSILGHIVKKVINKILKDASKETEPKTESHQQEPLKNHPWRLCPLGESWVLTHTLTVPASSKKPKYKTVRSGHCRKNPNGKEFYTADEFRKISALYFQGLANNPHSMPIPDALDFPNGNKYDLLIGGWTKFWNEILKPDIPLTPDFAKALIATESSFMVRSSKKSKEGTARGLIQITEKTRNILWKDPNKELRNHFIEMSAEEAQEPEINIAAGIRWLHHKRNLLKKRLKREVTWEEAGWEYKGIFKDVGGKDKIVKRIVKDLRGYHQRLKNQRAKISP